MKSQIQALLAALAIAATSLAASNAQGAYYQIDPLQSQIKIGGQVLGFIPIVAQKVGSNIAKIEGAMDATVDGDSLTFNWSLADAIEQPGPFIPGFVDTSQDPPVAGPAAPADVALFLGNASTGRLAIRNFAVSITGTTTLTGTEFDLTALTLTLVSGTLDFQSALLGQVGHEEIAGESANPEEGTGTLIGDTITIPINVAIELEISDGDPPQTGIVTLEGQIVAVLVPEPGTIAMLGMGMMGLIAIGYRRVRKAT